MSFCYYPRATKRAALQSVSFLMTAVAAMFFSQTLDAGQLRLERVEQAAAIYEKNHGLCAVVLMEAKSGRIVYLHNRELALNRRFPPGSLMKPLSAAVLCETESAGISFPQRVFCRGKFFPDTAYGFSTADSAVFNLQFDETEGKFFPCSVAKGHGNVSMREALVHSCNFFFLSAAQKDPQFYHQLVRIWKLDDPLFPGQQYDGTRSQEKDLSPFQKISAAIGEGPGVLLSPVKIAENYAALFENTPLLELFEGKGERTIRHDLPVSESVRQMIRSALSGTMEEGTLARLEIQKAGCRVLAGKTGTSTDLKDKKNHHGWNALWIEKEDDRYILVTFVYHGSGSKEAAALSSAVLQAL